MPTNRTTFHAANFNVTKAEVVLNVYLDGNDLRNGGSKEVEVPSTITRLGRIVFDIQPRPLTDTQFTLKDALGNVLVTFNASVQNTFDILSLDDTHGLVGGDTLTLEWPAFTYACATQLPPGKQPRVLILIQFYEDPAVVLADQIEADSFPSTPRKRSTTLGPQ